MKRKILTILLSILAVFACVFAFIACGNGDNNANSGNGDKPPVVDTDDSELYKKYTDVYYCGEQEFIVLTEDKIWYDNTGLMGKYKIEEKVTNGSYNIHIYMYADLTDNNVEYINGIFYSNFISLDNNIRFSKGNDKPIPECPKSLDYTLSEDGTYYKVTGIGEVVGDVVVPKRYKFITVKEISDRAFNNNKNITSVEVPSTVDTMGLRAFEKCSNLESAKIEASITELTEEFFGGCTKLVDVYIPKTVTEINYRAFKDCEKIQNVYYGGYVEDWAKIKFGISASHASSNMGSEEPYWANPISGDGRKLIINDSTVTSCELENVSDGAFFQYKYLTSVKATTVGDYAFYYSSITSLSASTIGLSACEGCHNLKSFTGGGTAIGNNAFFDCTAMTSAFPLSETLSEIGENAFSFCNRLTSIAIPRTVVKIGKNAFAGNDMEEITFGDATDWEININGNSQAVDQDLTNKTVAARLLTQRESNNGYCGYVWSVPPIKYKLNSDNNSYTLVKLTRTFPEKELEIPSTYMDKPVTVVGDGNNRMGYVYSVIIGDNVTTIMAKAFYKCDILNSVTIEGSVTSIGSSAFYDCTGLTSIEIPNSVTSIGSSAFYGCSSLTSIEIPNSVTSIGDFAFRYCSSLTSIKMPNSVTIIGPSMFEGCSSLTSIEIPNRVTLIGMFAFASCSSLTSIIIPNSVTSLGFHAFEGCIGLTSIIIPNSVTSTYSDVFRGCDSLTIYCVAASKPSGWSSDWNTYNCPVVWGYKNQ